jgi:hypothetical protein
LSFSRKKKDRKKERKKMKLRSAFSQLQKDNTQEEEEEEEEDLDVDAICALQIFNQSINSKIYFKMKNEQSFFTLYRGTRIDSN